MLWRVTAAIHSARRRRSPSPRRDLAIQSLKASRPPGTKTRRHSARVSALSGTWSKPSWLTTAVKAPSRKGSLCASPRTMRTRPPSPTAAERRRAPAARSGLRSTPVTRAPQRFHRLQSAVVILIEVVEILGTKAREILALTAQSVGDLPLADRMTAIEIHHGGERPRHDAQYRSRATLPQIWRCGTSQPLSSRVSGDGWP